MKNAAAVRDAPQLSHAAHRPDARTVRRVGAVTGGVFAGERLSGEVLDGGNDWQTVRSDGAVTLDVRLVLKTDDEAMIGMIYRGIRHGSPDVLARIDRGEAVDPATYYFRVSSVFETAAPKYDWLNRLLAVGIGHRPPMGRSTACSSFCDPTLAVVVSSGPRFDRPSMRG